MKDTILVTINEAFNFPTFNIYRPCNFGNAGIDAKVPVTYIFMRLNIGTVMELKCG